MGCISTPDRSEKLAAARTKKERRVRSNRTQPRIMAQIGEKCPICVETIKEAPKQTEGQEALICEGKCQKWLQRLCGGVQKDSYAILSSSSAPFLCPSCSFAEHRQLISSLTSTVESLKEEIRLLKLHNSDKVDIQPLVVRAEKACGIGESEDPQADGTSRY